MNPLLFVDTTDYKDLRPLSGTTFIGLGYKARNGKDSAAAFIHQAFPARTTVLRFGDALKAYARVAYGMTKKDGPLLQKIGTEIVRAKDPHLWVRTLYWTVQELAPEFVLVPDVRFPNEADFVKRMGGSLVKVVRQNPDGSQYISDDRDPNHSSETALDDYDGWDHIIEVESCRLDYLRLAALKAFEQIRQKVGR